MSHLNSAAPISVEEAIQRVLLNTPALLTHEVKVSSDILGSVLAETLVAPAPFPSFPASIMDGYAVKGPIEPGVYDLIDKVFAGDNPSRGIQSSSEISYITTGSQVPSGANSVVKIEDTEKISENQVRIKVSAKVGANIREIGSDIEQGQVVLKEGDRLGPVELGLLATTGFTKVKIYKRPVIGVMSTGNELVEPWEETTGSQIRDSNRISLYSAFREDGYDVIDYGIMKDSKEEMQAFFLKILHEIDVIITSGGVSMGAADFIKPILAEIGKIHFNKLNMKPGKPTTFATIAVEGKANPVLFFGLPGNPVSCIVTKSLFVNPALKRLQGFSSDKCLHPQINVKLIGDKIVLDPERPEYHRVYITHSYNRSELTFHAESTGNQRSSRLLSMRSANGLLVLPQGPGVIEPGTVLPALIVGSFDSPPAVANVHSLAANVDSAKLEAGKTSTATVKTEEKSVGDDWKVIKTGLLTISDRASSGVYTDESGPEMAKLLEKMNTAEKFPLKIAISATAIVPDNPEAIRQVIESWTDPNNKFNRVDLILTSGGTGFGERDYTPETIRPLLHREAPGIAQQLLNEGLQYTPLAVLSRPVVGTRHATFIATLPGSVKAVRENIQCLQVLFPRIFELLKTGGCNFSTHNQPSVKKNV
mmetsp:Transcript_16494/g.17844  ORF Transcript_16494/g.17844 Transcript_16494/m.17844 type:complete len:648 (+) Transcript_16494:44-1987(+)